MKPKSDLESVGDPLIDEARKRWKRCTEWEAVARTRFLSDVKFANGDDDNGYQWPNAARQSREIDSRPCLTMNIVQQHNFQVSNRLRKNKQSMKVVALGNGATEESAKVFRDVIRRIEYLSQAQAVYTIAREFQIEGGIGWWRIVTDYIEDSVDEQEIFLRPVNDPLSVYMDPDCEQKNTSDAKFAFVFDSLPMEDFVEAYPKYEEIASLGPLGTGGIDDDLTEKDHVRLCEYFRKVPKKETLISFVHNGQRRIVKKSMLHESMHAPILDDPQTRIRTQWDEVVEWKLIAGMKVIDSTVWPGRYIPLVRCIGKETRIEGIMDRKGLTRAMKGAQVMYNFNASAQAEFAALQGKTPWTGSVDAIEEYETIWGSANTVNHSYLPYKHKDQDGEAIPPEALPHRTEPPAAAPAFQMGMETAVNQAMMTSGQYQNQLGMLGNERTGSAIGKRQEQSDTAVFHFEDNYEEALTYSAMQLIDLIPKIYDTQRVLKIQADDGSDQEIEVDPRQRGAFLAEQGHNREVVRRVFNPKVGQYGVGAGFGPSIGTKREQTVEAFELILTQNPGLTAVVGDLLLGSMEFDKAQEAAQRLRRMVPPMALGEGPSQQEQALQAQVGALQHALTESLQRQGKDQVKLIGKDQMRDIDAYKAETDRMKALAKALPTDQEGLRAIIEQLVGESLKTSLLPILKANAEGIGDQAGEGGEAEPPAGGAAFGEAHPGVPGAIRAPDREWYLADPTRKGKYIHMAPLAQEHIRPSVVSGGPSG